MSDRDRDEPETDEAVNEGRRRLLRMASYVPPIVIGAITLSQAGCQPSCPSCPPLGGTAMCRTVAPATSPAASDKIETSDKAEPGS